MVVNSIHWPLYCTVHGYIVLQFVIQCGFWEVNDSLYIFLLVEYIFIDVGITSKTVLWFFVASTEIYIGMRLCSIIWCKKCFIFIGCSWNGGCHYPSHGGFLVSKRTTRLLGMVDYKTPSLSPALSRGLLFPRVSPVFSWTDTSPEVYNPSCHCGLYHQPCMVDS